MDILLYLAKLAQSRKEVGVIGLGTFYKKKSPGRYDVSSHTFIPPSFTLHFKTDISEENALAEYIHQEKKISIDSANYFIGKFADELHQQLQENKQAALGVLGKLVSTDEGIVYEPGTESDSADYYGLPSLAAVTIPKTANENLELPATESANDIPAGEQPELAVQEAPDFSEITDLKEEDTETAQELPTIETVEDSEEESAEEESATETVEELETEQDLNLESEEAEIEEEIVEEPAPEEEGATETVEELETEQDLDLESEEAKIEEEIVEEPAPEENDEISNPPVIETVEDLEEEEAAEEEIEEPAFEEENKTEAEEEPAIEELTEEEIVVEESTLEENNEVSNPPIIETVEDLEEEEATAEEEIKDPALEENDEVSNPPIIETVEDVEVESAEEECTTETEEELETVTTENRIEEANPGGIMDSVFIINETPPAKEPKNFYKSSAEQNEEKPTPFYLKAVLGLMLFLIILFTLSLLFPSFIEKLVGIPNTAPIDTIQKKPVVIAKHSIDTLAKQDSIKAQSLKQDSIKPDTIKKAEPIPVATVLPTTYEVIGSSVIRSTEASAFIADMKAKYGIRAKIVSREKGRKMKISIATFPTKKEADAQIIPLEKKLGISGMYTFTNTHKPL
ncbi:hypothetical protein LPB86_12495 [Pedobacter sp. MC2016-14]|uniref:hypothetical protein n=1 Tax=Pedobacter sp. MC2016-14 TaxID=2897327 RepID=UPI001E5263F2|nr:hypothetical protein [Pedobacter sp. MC2016-14]MCD0489051.1 hypothetical protein [Pedobacter sp. MC2016-14]